MTTRSASPAHRYRRINFGAPIMLLVLLLALLTGAMLWVAVEGQDEVAHRSSITIASAAFRAEREALEEHIRDYSWWNEAVENLVFDFDSDWATNDLAQWLRDNFDISRTFVVGPGRQQLHATLEARPIAAIDPAWKVPSFTELIAKAEALPNEPSASVSAYIDFPEGVHLVAASKLLQEADHSGHPPYPEKGILVVTRRVDGAFLAAIEDGFGLADLQLRSTPGTDGGRAHLPLPAPGGEPAAHVGWVPAQPGQRLLEQILLPLGLAFVMIGGVIGVIIVRAREATRALEQAFHSQAAVQEQLEFMARHDDLTGLPNRTLFLEHLGVAIANAARDGSGLAVQYFDLDGLKQVNDTLGHATGDELLREVAARLRGRVRAADTLARFGGDEFAVLQRDVDGRDAVQLLAERIIEALDASFDLGDRSVRIGVSIGIAFQSEGDDSEALLHKADRALYRAKREGGHTFRIHDPEFDARDQAQPE